MNTIYEQDLASPAENTAGDRLFDSQLLRWKFFLPSVELTKRIWQLNDALGTEYFEREFQRLTKDEPEVPELAQEVTEDPNWLQRIVSKVSEIVFHKDEDTDSQKLSDEEFVAVLQKVISERIYNHLAMLFRSPHARKGGAFSLQKELTRGMVEKLGLGLSLNRKTNSAVRADCEVALNDLADEFQKWFVVKQKGAYSTVWGEVYSSAKNVPQNGEPVLILTPDVTRGITFVAASA